jgi:hypothetical protein
MLSPLLGKQLPGQSGDTCITDVICENDMVSHVLLAHIGRTVHHSFLQGSLHLITCQAGTMEYIWIML